MIHKPQNKDYTKFPSFDGTTIEGSEVVKKEIKIYYPETKELKAIKINEGMKLHNDWYKKAKQIKTDEELRDFKNKLLNNYIHDYGTICHAITALGIGMMTLVDNSKQGGITGFQAGAIMWEFIKHWNYTNNKCGIKLIDYDKMLFPQYEGDFNKIITESIFKLLQDEANKNLNDKSFASPNVINHWEKISKGVAPFGYKIKKD